MRCATDIDGKTAGSIAAILGPVLSLSILLMIVRIPLSWYPNLDGKKLPWVIAVAPTEPLLGPTRRAVPPVGGVDVAPVSIYQARCLRPCHEHPLSWHGQCIVNCVRSYKLIARLVSRMCLQCQHGVYLCATAAC